MRRGEGTKENTLQEEKGESTRVTSRFYTFLKMVYNTQD
jgi:hypothetical protein